MKNKNQNDINSSELIHSYVDKEDWRVRENANAGYSYASLVSHLASTVIAKHVLNEVYPAEISDAHRNGDFHIHDLGCGIVPYCFTGDTKIRLLNGTTRTLKELADARLEYFWVYSKDTEGNTVPGKAHSARITKRSAKLVEVTLDNNEVIRCTPDHPFMLRTGGYKAASKLKCGDSLKREYFYLTRNGYQGIYHSGTTRGVHRIVMEHELGHEIPDGYVVHHLDRNKFNNDPDNLALMPETEHKALELRKTMSTDLWKAQNSTKLSARNKTEKMRNSARKRQVNRNQSDAQRAACSYGACKGVPHSASLKSTYLEFVSRQGFCSYAAWVQQNYPVNHKVLDVKELDYTEDVYDITVDKYHNFLLDAGVYVHNCAGWSMRELLLTGFKAVHGRAAAGPAKHFDSALLQLVNFLCTLQTEWA